MKSQLGVIQKISYAIFAAFIVAMAVRSHNDTTIALVISAVLMFAFCWANATHLLGAKSALKFVLIAITFGWFAEQMGSSYGWFFGSYTYTEVLGWRLGDVPVIIPLMWFALCYVGFMLANFIVWQQPVDGSPRLSRMLFMSFLAAALVTAYDLGADPYMVFVLKAWIMAKTDGWWFGETLQGFVGWMVVGFSIIFTFRLSVRKQGLRQMDRFSKWHALLPFSIYAFSLVFQMLKGYPVETRTIAVFAMGIPLLCALAAWWRWEPTTDGDNGVSPVSNARMAQMDFAADPLADDTLAVVLGPCDSTADASIQGARVGVIGQVNRQFDQWQTNRSIVNWQPSAGALAPHIATALQQYLEAGRVLPPWADRAKIERAEALFMNYGPLSCTLLFCASLPECYVVPDLSEVLQVAGQLEQHTEYRIRATAAMIFPVMMRGGLTDPAGSGVAQVLKVRLIHATIRNLILHGSPAQAMTALGDGQHVVGAGVRPAQANRREANLQEALISHGWKLGEDGLPCCQKDLAYTLLTFGYVFLRSMRKLAQPLSQADEEAYLHLWNVVGHLLGIRRELMPDTMGQASAMFSQIQESSRASLDSSPPGGSDSLPGAPDPRSALGQALMTTMEQVIPLQVLKGFPVLMTRYLCGPANADAIGVDNRASWLSKILFNLVMWLASLVDTLVRLVWPQFSFVRLITRVLGYHLMSKIMMDQTHPLKLPETLLNEVNSVMGTWGDDSQAPRWMNRLEDHLTKPGKWNAAASK
jgi:uncharacterized membrane protein